jgi:predicted GH43/DUF377 family glycosyl hydrolase
LVPFIDHFKADAESNRDGWLRSPHNPVIRYGDAWCREFIAPSSVLVDGDTVTLYCEGGAGDRECIGRYSSSLGQVPKAGWSPDPGNPLLEPAAVGFDRGSVFDPAAVRFRGQTHLYYSATANGAHAFAERGEVGLDDAPDDETIGHAVEAADGFVRDPHPVINGRCPYAVEVDGQLYLFYVKVVAGGYRIYGARSADGVTFTPLADGRPVLGAGAAGQWDSFTVTTPKVFADSGQFVMLYAGDDRLIDDPTGIGIAVSTDLVSWRRHPGNPVFVPGQGGQFDSLSVASPVPLRVDGSWQIFYAGTARPVAEGLQSQIGVARLLA